MGWTWPRIERRGDSYKKVYGCQPQMDALQSCQQTLIDSYLACTSTEPNRLAERRRGRNGGPAPKAHAIQQVDPNGQWGPSRPLGL
jgi:hypothetical protein